MAHRGRAAEAPRAKGRRGQRSERRSIIIIMLRIRAVDRAEVSVGVIAAEASHDCRQRGTDKEGSVSYDDERQ